MNWTDINARTQKVLVVSEYTTLDNAVVAKFAGISESDVCNLKRSQGFHDLVAEFDAWRNACSNFIMFGIAQSESECPP